MKLLIVTQKVDKNDSVLGFFHRWIELLAEKCEAITVICLYQGAHSLPSNVRILSLGKERGGGRGLYIINFFKYLWRERKNYDSVFVHMNPEYAVLAGWWWWLSGRRIVLWYVHRSVTWYLRLASWFAHVILTVAPESCRIRSPKVQVVGHGIDTDYFSCPVRTNFGDTFNIISVGRITRIKNLDVLIQAARILRQNASFAFKITLIGEPATDDDKIYFEELKTLAARAALADVVTFSGAAPHSQLREKYCGSDVSVNLAPTGGLDKVVLESMACGVPVLVANQAFAPFLKEFRDDLMFSNRDSSDLASKIQSLFERRALLPKIGSALRSQVQTKHSLSNLITRIIASYAE